MAAHGARRLSQMTKNLNVILGVELLCAAQGVEFRAPLSTSAPLSKVLKRLRKSVESIGDDRFLSPDLEKSALLIASNEILKASGLSFPELSQ